MTITAPVANWAGNVTFGAASFHQPASVDELRRLVAGSRQVRVLGSGHSFNRLADTTGDLVSLANLPRTIDIDIAAGTVTVAAQARYGELAAHLHRAGYGLPGMASLPHISVAGACATGTHGSGDGTGNLATAVRAVELVTADGDLVTLRQDRADDRFPGAVVALGALGVVTRLTLALVPTYQVRQYVYEDLPFQALATRWDEVFASAYSVSAFTYWDRPYADQVWRKQTGSAPAPDTWLEGRLAAGPRHPIRGAPVTQCTEQLGVPGPWHTRLPHFRPEHTPSAGDELQSEYLLPRERAGQALAALDRIRDRIAPVLHVAEVRTVAADELWLSPSYRCDSVAFHFTWVADAAAVAPVIEAVEEQLVPLAARPHWGKLFALPPAQIRARYPRWDDFAALARDLDPGGTFRNDFLARLLG